MEAADVRISLVRRGGSAPVPFDEFGRYAAACNADPSQHIGYVGVESDEVAADFEELEGDYVFAAARDGAQLCGLLCAEWDVAIGRTWLLGPWAGTPELMDQLYDAVRPVVPAEAAEHELFCDAANPAVIAFAQRHGFSRGGEHVILRFPRERLGDLAPVTLPPLTPDLFGQFAALHDRTFPDTDAPSAVLLGRKPPIFVEVDGDTLLGYAALKLRPEFADAQIEFIAVAEAARGQGLGARLATAALHEAFTDHRYRVMDIGTSNPVAQRLYEKVGFVLRRSMRSFRTT
jgi:ribosomal protein S18 acetylase RimI-like enzyme